MTLIPRTTGDMNIATSSFRADGDSGGNGLYGPRGWIMRTGVWRELAPYLVQNEYTVFRDLGPNTAQKLLNLLSDDQLEDRQNLAPSLRALLRACVRAEGSVRLSGYVIGPQRLDERITVEALWIEDPDLLALEISDFHDEHCACSVLWRTVCERYALDAQAMPDEIRKLPRYGDRGPLSVWLWWD